MNRLRIGLLITAILGIIYAAAGLFDSLGQFALGLIVSATAVIGYGLIDHIEAHRDDDLARGRDAVWARRDAEARWTPGLYMVTDRDDEVA